MKPSPDGEVCFSEEIPSGVQKAKNFCFVLFEPNELLNNERLRVLNILRIAPRASICSSRP